MELFSKTLSGKYARQKINFSSPHREFITVRSQVKKLSNPIWESMLFLIPPLIKTFTSAFYYSVCVSDPLHTHTYKNSHTNKHTQTFGTEEPNVIIEMSLFGIIETSLIV